MKGKSLESAQEVKQDFGIFVKKILEGGAAQMVRNNLSNLKAQFCFKLLTSGSLV